MENYVLYCDSDISISDDEDFVPEDLESLHKSENGDNKIDTSRLDEHSSPNIYFI